MKFKNIRIYFKDGKVDEIPKKLWKDYMYQDNLFVVIWKGAWIAIYRLPDIHRTQRLPTGIYLY